MKITTLEEAFVHLLSDVYSAEKQLTKALPKMAKAATNETLAEGFTSHLEETQNQIERLDDVVSSCGIKLMRMKCKAMEGLVEEGSEIIDEIEAGPVRDAMLIVAAQKVEHYEIASYGSLVELAKELGYDDAVTLLEETLEEEKATDEKLNVIAVDEVNNEARQASEQDSDEQNDDQDESDEDERTANARRTFSPARKTPKLNAASKSKSTPKKRTMMSGQKTKTRTPTNARNSKRAA